MSTVYTPVYHLNMTEPASNIPTLRTASGEYIAEWVEAMRTEIEGLTPERSTEQPRRSRGWWPR